MTDAALHGYASLAAHQLGEAVCLVKGCAAMLDDADPTLAAGLMGSAERVQRFVDDLLEVTDTASTEVDVERIELADVLAAAVDGLTPHLATTGVRIEAGDLPAVSGSRVLLERLFAHLLRDALAARDGRPLRIRVGARETGADVAVAVRDTGRALEPDALMTAFEPFARGRGRGPLVGAGVGPALCRLVVERHGGTIAARRLPEGGMGVEFTLPRAP